MNMDQVHTPERLEGETQRQYRDRQAMSKRLAERTRTAVAIGNGPHFATRSRKALRNANKALGHRQVKRLLREHRAAEAAKATNQPSEKQQ